LNKLTKELAMDDFNQKAKIEPPAPSRSDIEQRTSSRENGHRPTTNCQTGILVSMIDGRQPIAKMAVGQLVISRCGRDRGEAYLVLELIDETSVYLVNGDKRRIENPKRKNIKHLWFCPAMAETLAGAWEAGQQVSNIEVRKVIAGLISEARSKMPEVEDILHPASDICPRGVEK
jgi:ribosomal protein L14E/L6E/L27E